MINKKILDDNVSYKQLFYSINKVLVYICLCLFLIFMQLFFMTLRLNEYLKQEENQNSIDTASAYSDVEVTPYDTITDLTGTSWILNDDFSSTDFGKPVQRANSIANVQTTSNYGYFIDFTALYNNSWLGFVRLSSIVLVSMPSYDTLEAGDTIQISGGTDVTNSNLISWLQANATQVISGYSSTINLSNCSCDKLSDSGLSGSYTATITANTGYILSNVTTTLGTITFSNNNKVATITISDVNDDFTISATASLIYHNISYNLGNVVVISNKPTQIDEISTISITFQPFANYVLPQYINIEGVTSYQWDYETGVLSLTNAYDNVDITINAEYRSGEYTFIELIDSVTLVPVNTFFNLFDFEIFGVNIYSLLLSSLVLFVIIKVILKVFK